MFSWCSYCQKYLGEFAPYDQHNISHGICKQCHDGKVVFNREKIQKSKEIAVLFAQMGEAVKKKDFAFIKTQYEKLIALSVSNSDIFSGIYQPLLYEIGKLWENREVTVAEEHEVTSTIEALVDLGFKGIPNVENLRNSSKPMVMISSTSQNQHILGLRLIEHWLCEKGIENRIIVPGMPEDEFLSLAQKLKPPVVGLSVALPTPEVKRTLTKLVQQARGARVIIGGRFIREYMPNDLPAGITLCNNILDLSDVLIQSKLLAS